MRSQCGAVAGSIGQRAAGQAAARRAADAADVRGEEAGAIQGCSVILGDPLGRTIARPLEI